MYYRTSDGKSFNSYSALCDYLAAVNTDPEVKQYYRDEKAKLHKRQRSLGSRILLAMMLPATLPICTLLGHPENAINAVFGSDED